MKRWKGKAVGFFLMILLAIVAAAPYAAAHPQTTNVLTTYMDGWNFHYADGHISKGGYFHVRETGERLFCLEPHLNAVMSTRDQWVTLAQYFNNDAAFAKKLSLIAYYGEHSGWGLDGWAAAQSLMWNYIMQRNGEAGEQWISTDTLTTREQLQGYYDAIEQKVNAYDVIPSFDKQTITLQAGQSTTITDANGALGSMEMDSGGPIQVSKDGNRLTITATGTDAGTGRISLKKQLPGGFEGTNFVYTAANYQDLMTYGAYEPVYASLNVQITELPVSMQFSKQDLTTGKELPGAKLSVTDGNGNPVDTWISGTEPHTIQNLRKNGVYTLTEIIPTPGYATASSIRFTAAHGAAPVVMKDDMTRIQISKKDVTTGGELAGASLEVTDKNGKVMDQWVSKTEPHMMTKLVVGETYTLTETLPAPGYVTAKAITFTVADTGSVQKIEMKDDITKFELSKKDLTTGEELAGASLQVTDKSGKVIDKWVSGKTPHSIKKLTVGETYTLTETLPAPGYVTAKAVTFTAADTGSVQKIEMKDDITKIRIQKVDLTTKTETEEGEGLSGATLQVMDREETVLDEWVTDGKPHVMEKLVVGETYILRELSPAEGYVTAEPVSFTVEDTEDIQFVIMEDDITKVEISKRDLAKGEELPGAHLQVTDQEGVVVDEWISQEVPHRITKLVAGGTYILTETRPADGYVTAEPVTFVVEDTGEIQKVTMEDDITKTEIFKVDTADGKNLAGAALQIIDREGKIVYEWTSGETPELVERLTAGETYILHEETAPEGYLTAQDVEFTVSDTGEVQTVAMEDELAVINLEVAKRTIRRTQTGDTYKYIITTLKNASNTALENFTCTDHLPEQVMMRELHTGTFSDELEYSLAYQTNRSDEWHPLASGLNSTANHIVSFGSIPMEEGEQITAYRYEFGTAPAGFQIGGQNPIYFTTVKPGVDVTDEMLTDITLCGDWRGVSVTDQDDTVTLLFEGKIEPLKSFGRVITGDGSPVVCLAFLTAVSGGVIAGFMVRRSRTHRPGHKKDDKGSGAV
ncbi:MAG: hypothetical protein HFI67_01290 [Lachnospiraceae bacterium]|nr:hypothetical protein [Lachnospiraceae bacterium]